ncbi:MAG: hypothetical protein ACRDTR_23555, partial [Rubrobacter sp.]
PRSKARPSRDSLRRIISWAATPDLQMVFVLLAHAAATLFMVGVIWFVQIVHYPLFGRVGRSGFAAYSGDHSRLTGFVVGPPMLIEAATAVALVVRTPQGISPALVWAGFVLLAAIWLSTALLQAPRHTRLGQGFDLPAHRFLVASNWLRTALWSIRGLLVLLMLFEAMG